MDDDLKPLTRKITLFGIPASRVAHRQVFRCLHEELEVLNYEVKEEDQPRISRFKEALSITADQIKKIREEWLKI